MECIIGVLGGMGTYATIHFFQQYAEVFPAEKEWDRPRIIIDNRCTMPSRVKAYIYKENIDLLIKEMSESIRGLINLGCTDIILDCNTSHLFLSRIYEKVPELQRRIIHIIDKCVQKIIDDKVKKVYILGTEGTIESNVYQNTLGNQITSLTPSKDEYHKVRECIEAVKQNHYTEKTKKYF